MRGGRDPGAFTRAAGADWADIARRGTRLFAAMATSRHRGVEIATTPKREVWREGKVSLHRYEPAAEPRLGPLLILQGLFGRQTIADLEPRRSLVRRLLEAGADTWVIDWGNPTRADRCNDFTDYADIWLGEALARIAEETGARAGVLGICQGGVFALCQAALHPERVAGLALAVTPVDFHAEEEHPSRGHLNAWCRGLDAETVDAFLAERGLVPGAIAGAVFQSLSPMKAATKYGPDLLALADDPQAIDTFLRMEAWLADRPDHPAAAARQWLVELYIENRLARGRFRLDGRRVELTRIACPILNIVALEDHIVPPASARALDGLTASRDYRLLEVPTGHVGAFVSEKAQGIVAPALIDWLGRLDEPAARPRAGTGC